MLLERLVRIRMVPILVIACNGKRKVKSMKSQSTQMRITIPETHSPSFVAYGLPIATLSFLSNIRRILYSYKCPLPPQRN